MIRPPARGRALNDEPATARRQDRMRARRRFARQPTEGPGRRVSTPAAERATARRPDAVAGAAPGCERPRHRRRDRRRTRRALASDRRRQTSQKDRGGRRDGAARPDDHAARRRRSRDAAAVGKRPATRVDSASATSGRQDLAALAATAGEDRAAGASAHAQPEPMRLRAAAVVRLERALAHSGAPEKESAQVRYEASGQVGDAFGSHWRRSARTATPSSATIVDKRCGGELRFATVRDSRWSQGTPTVRANPRHGQTGEPHERRRFASARSRSTRWPTRGVDQRNRLWRTP